jgi:hypothetical protein
VGTSIITMPFPVKISMAGTASPEQLVPMTPTICGSATSF